VQSFPLFAAVLLLVVGCRSSDEMPAWPPSVMSIPDGVPDEMAVVDKDGTEHPAHGKDLYAGGYRAGWKRCVWDFDHDRLDLAVQKTEPPLLGHYIVVVRGWDAGYLSCWQAIRAAKANG
jgi:hypothetical protein